MKRSNEIPSVSSKIAKKCNDNSVLDTTNKDSPDVPAKATDDDVADDADLLLAVEKYAFEVEINDVSNDAITEHELKPYPGINLQSYRPHGDVFYPMPTNKYHMYNELTSALGYEYSSKNDFLRRDGVMQILCQPLPDFCIWKHGLRIYLPSVPMALFKKSSIRMAGVVSHCIEHEFQCPTTDVAKAESPCQIVKNVFNLPSLTYIVSGLLKVKSISRPTTILMFSVELDNANVIDVPNTNVMVSNMLSLKPSRLNVHTIKSCTHAACGVGKHTTPFECLPPLYKMCSAIVTTYALTNDHHMKRCFVIGRGILGNFFEKTRTIYPCSFNISDIYILE